MGSWPFSGSAVFFAACGASNSPVATSSATRATTEHVASSSTTKPSASSSLPTIATVERTACSAIGAHDDQGDRFAILSMHVSTVSPGWVLVEGLGFYSGTDQPPTVQEARSDLDELILNLRTGRMIGPTNIGFCQGAGSNVSDPDLSVVPVSVLAGWGLQPCSGNTSTTTSTVTPVTTAVSSSAPPPTASSSPSTAAASEFTVWAGAWGAHELELEIGPTGTGHLTYADLTLCPSCSLGGAPRGTMDFQLTSVTGNAANGAVTASSDSKNYIIGQAVKVSLAPGAPGQLLELSVNGQGPWSFCNGTSAGQCGA